MNHLIMSHTVVYCWTLATVFILLHVRILAFSGAVPKRKSQHRSTPAGPVLASVQIEGEPGKDHMVKVKVTTEHTNFDLLLRRAEPVVHAGTVSLSVDQSPETGQTVYAVHNLGEDLLEYANSFYHSQDHGTVISIKRQEDGGFHVEGHLTYTMVIAPPQSQLRHRRSIRHPRAHTVYEKPTELGRDWSDSAALHQALGNRLLNSINIKGEFDYDPLEKKPKKGQDDWTLDFDALEDKVDDDDDDDAYEPELDDDYLEVPSIFESEETWSAHQSQAEALANMIDSKEDQLDEFDDESYKSEYHTNENIHSTLYMEGNLRSSHPIEDNIQSNHPIEDNIQSNYPKEDNIQSNHPIEDNIQSNHPKEDNIQSSHPIEDNIQSNHPKEDNIQSNHPKEDNIQSNHPIEDNIQSNYPKEDNIQPSHPKVDNLRSSDPTEDKIRSNNPKEDNIPPRHIKEYNVRPNQTEGDNVLSKHHKEGNAQSGHWEEGHIRSTYQKEENTHSIRPIEDKIRSTHRNMEDNKRSTHRRRREIISQLLGSLKPMPEVTTKVSVTVDMTSRIQRQFSQLLKKYPDRKGLFPNVSIKKSKYNVNNFYSGYKVLKNLLVSPRQETSSHDENNLQPQKVPEVKITKLAGANVGENKPPSYIVVKSKNQSANDMWYVSVPINAKTSSNGRKRHKRQLTINRKDVHEKNKKEINSGSSQPDDWFVVEVVAVVDARMYREFNFDWKQLQIFLLHFWQSVNARFQALTDPNVQIKLKSINKIMFEGMQPFIEKNRLSPKSERLRVASVLEDFRSYVREHYEENPLMTDHDVAILLTGEDLCKEKGGTWSKSSKGIAYVRGACISARRFNNQTYDVGVAEVGRSYRGVLTAAHELAHLLGAFHDGEKSSTTCPPNSGYLMGKLWTEPQLYNRFSECSRRNFHEFLKNTWYSGCLLTSDPTDGQNYKLPKVWAGQTHGLEEQCLRFVDGKPCTQNYEREGLFVEGYDVYNVLPESQCGRLCCEKWSQPFLSHEPAADGTECGLHKMCYSGECLHKYALPTL